MGAYCLSVEGQCKPRPLPPKGTDGALNATALKNGITSSASVTVARSVPRAVMRGVNTMTDDLHEKRMKAIENSKWDKAREYAKLIRERNDE